MKGIAATVTGGLQIGSELKCIDNSGAKILQVISVRGYKGKRRTRASAGVASLINCKVITGNEKVRHQVFKAVIVRQRKEYARPSGIRIQFEDNAAVVVRDNYEPIGTQIKGPVAKEAIERFPLIAKVANLVV